MATPTQKLEADRIAVRFGELRVLEGVSLSLSPGRILGLIGPNGSGKSTLINVFSGYVAPYEGTVRQDGRTITSDTPDARARRGIVRTFQAVRLFARLTVAENLEAAAVARGMRRPEARSLTAEILDLLHLGPIAGLQAAIVPYGAERRVAIARALAVRPEYLLLDEPAAGLDESETDEMGETLRTICETRGCGMLVVEHDMRLIAGICHDTIVLSGGSVLATGAPATVMRDPRVIEAYLGTTKVEIDAVS